MSLYLEEARRLINLFNTLDPTTGLLGIKPFLMTIAFLNESIKETTTQFFDCEFLNDIAVSSQGQSKIVNTYNLICSGIFNSPEIEIPISTASNFFRSANAASGFSFNFNKK